MHCKSWDGPILVNSKIVIKITAKNVCEGLGEVWGHLSF